MKALVYLGPTNKALQERPKPEIAAPTDAIVRITKTTICGTDLHILKGDVPTCQPGWNHKATSCKSTPIFWPAMESITALSGRGRFEDFGRGTC